MEFDSNFLGPQELVDDDRVYSGSRYSDIREALFKNAYYMNWGAENESPLPVYDVTLGRVLKGLPIFKRWRFRQAAARTLDSQADLRWGEDRRGYRRLLHPNAVCLLGKWIIDQPTEYSGYFAEGSEGLIVGRYSTCCAECRRGYNRSLSLVGKIWPTTDPDHTDLLRPANFITQEDLGGARTWYMNDAVLRNAPDTSPWRRGWGAPILLLTGLNFRLLDREPGFRQVYTIAELGKPANEPTRAPKFMQIRVSPEQPHIRGNEIDFRDEVLSQIYDPGDPEPKRKLVFTIEVSDEGSTWGLLVQRRKNFRWTEIGRIECHEGVASYNGDFVLHFNHPPWRTDQNDPATVVRKRSG
jgi:hypothetical protein